MKLEEDYKVLQQENARLKDELNTRKPREVEVLDEIKNKD